MVTRQKVSSTVPVGDGEGLSPAPAPEKENCSGPGNAAETEHRKPSEGMNILPAKLFMIYFHYELTATHRGDIVAKVPDSLLRARPQRSCGYDDEHDVFQTWVLDLYSDLPLKRQHD